MVADKVVVVTGAAGGIGREIALLMAACGARVVVNDLGTSLHGEGRTAAAAEEVASEIRDRGGVAVANGDSVADWEGAQRIVSAALDHFGRIDCVVNSAGILRDRIFHKMSPAEFEAVVRVHLFGTFYVSRAAAEHFRTQESGTFIHMTSSTGLIGNPGQVNYGAAKLGVVGLSKCIALDMARFGVRSNCISPAAASRMTGSVVSASQQQNDLRDKAARLDPAKVAPLAVFLASDRAREVNGQIISIRGNEIFLYNQHRPIRSLYRSDGWSVDVIAEVMLPAFRAAFTPLDAIGDVFSWDPL